MSMKILANTLHILNNIDETIEQKDIRGLFNQFIVETIEFISINKTVRLYQIREDNTQVINSINAIVKEIIKDNKKDEVINSNFNKNANRLLAKEMEAQNTVDKLKTRIQKGSLIQSVLYDENTEEYIFLIAKIENKVFYDDTTLDKHYGIEGENGKLWKSCLFRISIEENNELCISEIRVFSNTGAKYWTDGFLEIDPITRDDQNTKRAFEQIDKALSANIKKSSPQDFVCLRNGLVTYFRSQDFFDYDNMMENLFNNYRPENIIEEVYGNFVSSLRELPEKKKFERQFNVIQKEVTARIKKVYNINTGIQLNITDSIEDLRNTLRSYEENGQKYLSIKIKDTEENNKEIYEAFL